MQLNIAIKFHLWLVISCHCNMVNVILVIKVDICCWANISRIISYYIKANTDRQLILYKIIFGIFFLTLSGVITKYHVSVYHIFIVSIDSVMQKVNVQLKSSYDAVTLCFVLCNCSKIVSNMLRSHINGRC